MSFFSFIVCSAVLTCLYSYGAVDFSGAKAAQPAKKLARENKRLQAAVFPGSVISQELSQHYVISSFNEMTVPFRPGTPGYYEAQVAFCAAGAYEIPSLEFDGKPVTPKTEKKGIITVLTFQTGLLNSNGKSLKIIPRKNAAFGFLFLNWVHDYSKFVTVPNDKWVDDGNGVWHTMYLLPIPFTGYQVELTSDAEAELIQYQTKIGKSMPGKPLRAQLLWYKCGPDRMCLLTVKTKPGAKFTLKTSHSAGGCFYRERPAFMGKTAPFKKSDYTFAELDNGKCQATVSVWDEKKNFYNGTRFDTSGIVTEFKANGKRYFVTNFDPEKHNSYFHDHVGGQAEEFTMPLSFYNEPFNSDFIRIGNGMYKKSLSESFFFSTPYIPVKKFPWTVKQNGNRIVMCQNCEMHNGYAYQYTKTVELLDGKPALKVSYQLKNTGKKVIYSPQYSHNFITFDSCKNSADYKLIFPNIHPEILNREKAAVKLDTKKRTFTFTEPKGTRLDVGGITSARQNAVILAAVDNSQKITITEDFVPYAWTMYAFSKVMCPESQKLINLNPGETASWSRTYLAE